jgi:hypothetical protein
MLRFIYRVVQVKASLVRMRHLLLLKDIMSSVHMDEGACEDDLCFMSVEQKEVYLYFCLYMFITAEMLMKSLI